MGCPPKKADHCALSKQTTEELPRSTYFRLQTNVHTDDSRVSAEHSMRPFSSPAGRPTLAGHWISVGRGEEMRV